MALTQIDPVAALVVIDMQVGIVGLPVVHPMGEVVARVAALARGFRGRGLPVVLVNVVGAPAGRADQRRRFAPAPGWEALIPELEAQASDHRVTKRAPGAFVGTTLEGFLRERGATQVVLAGVSTSSGVEATARQANDHGFNVVLVADAMTDMDAVMHQHSVERVLPKIGEVTTTSRVLEFLLKK